MMLAKSLQSAAGNAAGEANYIESVFQTWLYTGNGSTQTINNGIDLAGKGGLVWAKVRSNAFNHELFDTVRGTNSALISNGAFAAQAYGPYAFNANGFGFGSGYTGNANTSGQTYASWTFREQPKFFDVVTWTGSGVNRTIAHNLGSVPGFIIVKRTDATADWQCYHRSLANTQYMVLNSTAEVATGATRWNSTTPTDTVFSLGTDATVNASGGTFVAYVFAHDAGGFGESGEENVISCGSFATDAGGNATVNLGYEPQWLLVKATNVAQDWFIYDNMRGFSANQSANRFLSPNLSSAEGTGGIINNVLSTGFNVVTNENRPYIYIAIRRGPMKVPESGTSVFDVKTATQAVNSSSRPPAVNFVTDFAFYRKRETTFNWGTVTRLAGSGYLFTNTNNAEASGPFAFDVMNGFYPNTSPWDSSGDYVFNYFRRAPGFMDVCCYTGTGVARTVAHNLAAVPELMIVKARSNAGENWATWNSSFGIDKVIWLNLTNAVASPGAGNVYPALPTSTQFTVGTNAAQNFNGYTYVAYLFASCPGVSKVGSYTGTGTTQTINCGFTGGARFVLIKRTDSTGDWYVWDSARGIVAGNDPYLLLNSIAAEVTSTDYIDPVSSGFEISSTAPAAINASGGSFIFLAIA